MNMCRAVIVRIDNDEQRMQAMHRRHLAPWHLPNRLGLSTHEAALALAGGWAIPARPRLPPAGCAEVQTPRPSTLSGVHIPCLTSPPRAAAPNPHLAQYQARGLKGRILSGVQPTGNLHLGNYLGAIRNFARLQNDYECLYCVVDMHAITVPQDPKLLASQTREIAAAFLAAGVDRSKHIIFNQSMVPEHAQLAWIFNCVARMGWMSRMTQFKEKAGKDRENVSLGLFAYPALMAADILIYKATHVPVGEDQKQHLELTRDIATKFNNDFSAPDFFPITEPLIFGAATRVMSLRDGTKKMSKSDPSDYLAHQPDRRCRRDRQEDPPRQDRSACRCPRRRPTPRSGRKPTTWSASMPRWPTRRRTR